MKYWSKQKMFVRVDELAAKRQDIHARQPANLFITGKGNVELIDFNLPDTKITIQCRKPFLGKREEHKRVRIFKSVLNTVTTDNDATVSLSQSDVKELTAPYAQTVSVYHAQSEMRLLAAKSMTTLHVADSDIEDISSAPGLTELTLIGKTNLADDFDENTVMSNIVTSPYITTTNNTCTSLLPEAPYVLAYNITSGNILTPWGAFNPKDILSEQVDKMLCEKEIDRSAAVDLMKAEWPKTLENKILLPEQSDKARQIGSQFIQTTYKIFCKEDFQKRQNMMHQIEIGAITDRRVISKYFTSKAAVY